MTFSKLPWWLVSCVVLATCSSSDQRGASSSGGVEGRSSALSGSTTLSQALTDRVAVPGVGAGGLISEATTGDVDVTDDGSATYSVPLWVPDGVRGLRPSLALEYNSQRGDGFLGPKWGLKGLSAIVRCRRTLAHDGYLGGIDMENGDTFCLDGQRLIRVSGSPKGVGEFRNEVNPFRKIVVTSAGTSGPLGFQVFEADGRILYYGQSATSRLDVSEPNKTLYYAYYLDKVQDRYGNSILVSYDPTISFPAGSRKARELLPAQITWGATGDSTGLRSVRFVYYPRQAYDEEHHYVAGYGIVSGDRLKALQMSGPDGVTGVVVLKSYNFTYTPPPLVGGVPHGRGHLATIRECDGNNVCKRPTTVTWEPGSPDYLRRNFNDIDPALWNTSGTISNVYRRIIMADVNNDGRDDLIYRQYAPSSSSPTGQRLGWMVRINTTSGSTVSFGNPTTVVGADQVDPDPANKYPYSGDLILGDVNLDGYADIILGSGDTGTTTEPVHYWRSQLSSYYLWQQDCAGPGGRLPLPSCSFNNFSGLAVDDSPTIDTLSSAFSLGDLTGDGLPELVRPHKTPQVGVHWRTAGTSVSGDIWTYPGAFELHDLDGDGAPELLISTQVRMSATLPAGYVTNLPQTIMPPNGQRWMLDLNGDGLVDVAAVYANQPGVIQTFLSTGNGQFASPVTTTLPQGADVGPGFRDTPAFDNGVRVVDYDGDGRQDLLLMDDGVTKPATGPIGPTRSVAVALLSDGLGGFHVQATSVKVGDYADGLPGADPCGTSRNCYTPIDHGFRTSAVADLNGDGLPDIVQLELGNLVTYLRQGNKPEMVTNISEGTGRKIDIEYGSAGDPSIYTRDPYLCLGSNRLSCLTRGRWLAKSISVAGWDAPDDRVMLTSQYKYTGGVFDRFGRGFLGFERRDIDAPGSRHTTITYNPTKVTTVDPGLPSSRYFYPWAMKPITITKDVDTPQGPNSHHHDVKTFTYSADVPITAISDYVVLPLSIISKSSNCPSNGTGACVAGSERLLSQTEESFRYDPLLSYNALGKPTNYKVIHRDGTMAAVQVDETVNEYPAFDAKNWLMSLTRVSTTSTSYGVSPPETVTRTTSYTSDAVPNASTNLLTGDHLLTGDVTAVDFEPTADASVRRRESFGRDSRGRLQMESVGTVWPTDPTACNQSCTPTCSSACASAGPNPGLCIQNCMNQCVALCMDVPTQVRTTSYQYVDSDGVYVSHVTNVANPVQHTTRFWRHPGLGLLVETDDPNNLAEVTTYDTFGRMLFQQQRAGASTSYTYADASDPDVIGGTDRSILPEASAAREIKLHLDSFGREVSRQTPIDATRSTFSQVGYDDFGRVANRYVYALAPSTTGVSVAVLSYDDLDRLISDCHTSSTGDSTCKTTQYDGLTAIATDESGRVVTYVVDAMGRPAVERASLPSGTSDSIFQYGAFGLLEHQFFSDNSQRTDIGYDVLGRQTALARTDAGTRNTTYNAFGDVVGTSKRANDGSPAEAMTYGRDDLGRLRSVSGSGMNRTLYWDVTSTGASVPFSIGKPTEILDDVNSQVTFQYKPNGLLGAETWSLSLFGAPKRSYGTMAFGYDSQGRLGNQVFPQNLSGSYSALNLVYTYDQYMGTVASISDAVNTAAPLWSAGAHDDMGNLTSETLRNPSGVTSVRTSTYYLPTGQLHTAMLNGTATNAQLNYAYLSNGLPASLGMSGVSTWTSGFDYDNLGRLTAWGTGQCCAGYSVTLNYSYDSAGNLTNRFWGSPAGAQTVSYGKTATTGGAYNRTVSTTGSGAAPWTDTYQADLWGRIFDTPSVGLTYNAMDEVTSVVEKANGSQSDHIVRDGLGHRLATTYGTAAGGSYLLTLMGDQYEFRFTSGTGATEERCRLRANGKLVGDVVRTAASASKTATFYLTDNVGSVVAEASSTGTVTARSRVDPFGNLVGTAGNDVSLRAEPSNANPDGTSRLGYGGHEREPNWGLADMGARFYNPRLGRFITPDSMIPDPLDRRDHNPFAYVRNNPVALNDPTGHNPNGCDGQCGSPPSTGGGGQTGPINADTAGSYGIGPLSGGVFINFFNDGAWSPTWTNGDSSGTLVAWGTPPAGIERVHETVVIGHRPHSSNPFQPVPSVISVSGLQLVMPPFPGSPPAPSGGGSQAVSDFLNRALDNAVLLTDKPGALAETLGPVADKIGARMFAHNWGGVPPSLAGYRVSIAGLHVHKWGVRAGAVGDALSLVADYRDFMNAHGAGDLDKESDAIWASIGDFYDAIIPIPLVGEAVGWTITNVMPLGGLTYDDNHPSPFVYPALGETPWLP